LNTYLSAKPSFTSPQPLAAAAGLTIPLSITLSEIKLSAFVILVFSKQKGLTIVFRNDPLESIKVSSTFDSIQFVRDYLQRTIEGQLRNLMMDELPSIIHKLSLRLWCPDQLPKEDAESAAKETTDEEVAVNPFAAPPEDPVDSLGHVLDAHELASLSVDGGSGVHPLFSHKNLMRLAALNDSHRTLSLFTPGIPHAVFRAWLGPMERLDTGRSTPLATPSLVRTQSVQGNSTTYTFTDAGSIDNGSMPSRPSLVSLNSATTGLALGAGRHPRMSRKKKTRVVNLRHAKDNGTASETTSEMGETAPDSASVAGPSSEPIMPASIPEESEVEDVQPQATVTRSVRFRNDKEKALPTRGPLNMEIYEQPARVAKAPITPIKEPRVYSSAQEEKAAAATTPTPVKNPFNLDRKRTNRTGSDTSSVILEQAWISKMAGEIARRVYDEKQRNANFWVEGDDVPPPAYEAAQ
jgi:mitochondrial distribution and morphology protein 34